MEASWYAQTVLVSSGISDGKLGPSLLAIIHAEGQLFPLQCTESIFSVYYAWDLLQLACDSHSPASPVSAAGLGPPHPSHWEQLRAKPCTLGRWTGLPDIPAPSSCTELAALTKSLAQFGNNPLLWAPLQGLTTLIGIFFFPPLDQVVISSVPFSACCLSSSGISLILFSEETKHSSPPPLHLLYAPGPGSLLQFVRIFIVLASPKLAMVLRGAPKLAMVQEGLNRGN